MLSIVFLDQILGLDHFGRGHNLSSPFREGLFRLYRFGLDGHYYPCIGFGVDHVAE